jgi:hypothetical protein
MWYESLDGRSINLKGLTSPGHCHTEAQGDISVTPAEFETRYSLLDIRMYALQTMRPLWAALSLLILLKIIPLYSWSTTSVAASLDSVSHYQWFVSGTFTARCKTSTVLHYPVRVTMLDGMTSHYSRYYSRHSSTLHLFAVIHCWK